MRAVTDAMTHVSRLAGKQRWHRFLSPDRHINEALPIIQIHVNNTPCLPLHDSVCSCPNGSARLGRTWKKRSVRVTIISVYVTVWGNSANVETLVVRKKPLNFDLPLDYDAIKALGGVLLTQTGTVKFRNEALVCADFSVEFDQRTRHATKLRS